MFDTGYRMLGAQGRSREVIWGGRWEWGSGLGTHVHPCLIHVNVRQNQYSTVKQNKVKKKKKKFWYIYTMEYYLSIKKNAFGTLILERLPLRGLANTWP